MLPSCVDVTAMPETGSNQACRSLDCWTRAARFWSARIAGTLTYSTDWAEPSTSFDQPSRLLSFDAGLVTSETS